MILYNLKKNRMRQKQKGCSHDNLCENSLSIYAESLSFTNKVIET